MLFISLTCDFVFVFVIVFVVLFRLDRPDFEGLCAASLLGLLELEIEIELELVFGNRVVGVLGNIALVDVLVLQKLPTLALGGRVTSSRVFAM